MRVHRVGERGGSAAAPERADDRAVLCVARAAATKIAGDRRGKDLCRPHGLVVLGNERVVRVVLGRARREVRGQLASDAHPILCTGLCLGGNGHVFLLPPWERIPGRKARRACRQGKYGKW